MIIALHENTEMDKQDVNNSTESNSLDSSHSKVSASLEQELSKQYLVGGERSNRKALYVELITSNLEKNVRSSSQIYAVSLRCENSNTKSKERNSLQGFCGFIILIWSVVFTTPITLWPQTNVIEHPEYWYEPLLPISATYTLSGAALACLECWAVLKLDNFLTCDMFIKQILIGSTGFITPYISCYLIWVHFLGYRHPMPRIGDICLTICFLFRGFMLWFLISNQRNYKEKVSQYRLLVYLCLFPIRIFLSVIYLSVSTVFQILSKDYQWCAAILFPVIRKISEWITVEIGFKAAGERNISVKLAQICHVACLHTVTLSTLLGSDILSTTAYVLMIVECVPNLVSTFNIIRAQKCKDETKNALKCLTMKEFLEVLIPAAYSISFLIAYFGPNSEILGEVKNDYWQYEKVTNVFSKLKKIGLLFTVDAIRAMCIFLVLRLFCNLNMYKAYCEITHRYGFLFLAYLAAFLNLVFRNYDLAIFET